MAQASTVANPALLLAEVRADLDRGAFEDAEGKSRQGLIAGFEHPLLLNVAAFGLERAGRLDDAMRLLQRALELAPADALTLSSTGHWYSKAGRADEALKAFDAALSADPDLLPALHGRGLALAAMKDFEGAAAAQREVVRRAPRHTDALAALAGVEANLSAPDRARVHAEAALALDPQHAAAHVVLGALALQAGEMEAAAAAARAALRSEHLAGLHAASAQRLLADALDALGQYEEAFAAYAAANAILRSVHHGVYALNGYETGPQMCRRLAEAFAGLGPGDWRAPAVAPSEPRRADGHVFLVGFPRSGTTLLEQVLATHPRVVALEERDTLNEVGLDWFDGATLPRLFAMSAGEAEALRRRYWDNVAGFGVEPQGRIFVDKQPLTSLWIPYLAKVFPDARILFARRDPRDVVLSCFRRRFLMNGALYTFTDLRDGAAFYAGVMTLAESYRRFVELPWYDHRHEALVEDFEGETRRLCAFLDLPWTEALADFAETARRRDVQTPSAPQVRRGLYREGMGHWRRYAAGMADALPLLRPWAERMGYPA